MVLRARVGASVSAAIVLVSCVAVALTTPNPAQALAPAGPPGCGAPSAMSFTQSFAAAIADNTVTTSTVVVSGLPAHLSDVDAITNITHTNATDIDMTLTSPAGTVVTLTTDNGGSADNVFNGTRWDDDAAPGGAATPTFTLAPGHAQLHTYTDNVTATALDPEEALGAFIGEDPNGTWTLRISDDATNNPGSLASWQLDIQSLPAVPAQATTANSNDTEVVIPAGR